MNETDESLFAMDEQAYRAGVEREVNEEIKIDAPFEDRIVALLNDDTTEVGRVHLGIVHVFKLAEPKVEKREAMITGLTFLAKDELFARRETMETWSQICLDRSTACCCSRFPVGSATLTSFSLQLQVHL